VLRRATPIRPSGHGERIGHAGVIASARELNRPRHDSVSQVAHEAKLLGKAGCLGYVDAMELELKAWAFCDDHGAYLSLDLVASRAKAQIFANAASAPLGGAHDRPALRESRGHASL